MRVAKNKQVVGAQVLSLESKVAEYKDQQASFQNQLQQSKLEAQHAQRALRASQHDAAGPSDGAALRAMPGLALRMQDQGTTGMLDTDSWAEPASVEVKMLQELEYKSKNIYAGRHAWEASKRLWHPCRGCNINNGINGGDHL